MKKIYSEVRCDYHDDDAHFTTIDAWRSGDDNEEGKVVAVVHDSGDVWYIEPDARVDEGVAKAILEVKNRLGCNLDTKAMLLDRLVSAQENYHNFIKGCIEKLPEKTAAVMQEDGEPLLWTDIVDNIAVTLEIDKICVGDNGFLLVHIKSCDFNPEDTWHYLKDLQGDWSAILDYVQL